MSMVYIEEQVLMDIADAIRSKNGEDVLYYPSEMPGKILNLSGGGIPDNYLFMEGKGFNLSIVNTSLVQYAGSGWYLDAFNPAYFYAISSNNGAVLFKTPFCINDYRKVMVEAEVLSGSAGAYNISSIGLRRYSLINNSLSQYQSFDKGVNFTYYGNKYNYTGTSPWYQMPRTVIEIDTSDFPEDKFNIVFQKCDCNIRIYNLWLE